MKKLKGLLVLFLGFFTLNACSSDSEAIDEDKTILVSSIVINGSDITDGQTKQFTPVVLPNNATDRTVTWSVSDESIALISEKGILTPLENGTVQITATANDKSGLSAQKTIKISGVAGPVVLVESLTISGSDITDGQAKQFSVSVLPNDATNKVVVWSVSDTSIAEINSEGLLTPKKNGTVTVISTSTDGSGVKGELSVAISGIVLTSLKAENVLLWQRSNGGWPKYHNDFSGYDRAQTESEKIEAENTKNNTDTTIDNEHTIGEIRILLSAYKATNNTAYLDAAVKGIDFIFEMQYDNGGWPQYYPLRNNYSRHITYNDNAMGNVMNLMRDIFLKKNNLELIDESYIVKAETAFNKGIDVILQTQVVINGIKTAWCAQHDEVTLKPRMARSYELASNSGSESVGIVRLLMTLDNPSTGVIDAVKSAVAWFESVKIVGYALQEVNGDKVLVESPGNVMWARFYTLDDYTGDQYESLFNAFNPNEPFFCSRDTDPEGGGPRKTIAEISSERRNGYSWYGSWPKNLISTEYSAWKAKHGI
ncbi:pectate lyase [Aestuariibaculum sediminum]|uniref:Pectate lyase n=1 Tax=Aestuariibaculum sediminum TaxID=2770637 RepID=A0A8J6PXY2_9FLAO|nr:pectate lyase [Aestuariibaculum sediminum]MBD0830842.1 pectate lyase [Aestuariibaculum sediminum]